jgi:hypothetical protein
MDYCDGAPDFASGGFIADSEFTGASITNGSQQQWVTRNSNLDGWSNGVWNQVFCGDNGAPAQNFGNGGVFTTLATCPVTEEEPFLYTDSHGNYNVFVPGVRHNSSGPAWASGTEAGTSIALSKFFIASPGTSGAAMTAAMARGLNLILSPGVYDLDQPIVVPHPDTVVLGLGMATLVPQHGNAAMIAVSNSGVKLSGLIIDAGPVRSPVLLSVGTPGPSSATDPDLIQDVFFRIGGAETTPVSAAVSLLDNASNSIVDDIWAWRADQPVRLDGQPDPGRLPLLPGHRQRQELPGLRDGQLHRVHPDLGDAVRRRGLPGPQDAGRAVPQPPRRLSWRFGRRQVDHQRRRRPGDLGQ